MAKIIKRYSNKVLACIVVAGMFGFYFSLIDNSQAAQVSSRSDTMNNSALSATSNHTFQFTIADSLADTSGGDPSVTGMSFVITFPSGFSLRDLNCASVSLAFGAYPGSATSISTGANGVGLGDAKLYNTTCFPSATSWGLIIASTTRTLTLFTPTSTFTYVPTSTQVVVKVGKNATDNPVQTPTARNAIINPSSANQYDISIAGGSGNLESQTWPGTGTVSVYVIGSIAVSATVAETLTFSIAGLPGISWAGAGADAMSGCATGGWNDTTDDDDSETGMIFVTTTAGTVPFGNPITSGNVYQGCQALGLSTNAGLGYTISQRSNTPLQTSGGVAIRDTTCDSGPCTPYVSGAWTSNGDGLGVSCRNSATSNTCSGTGPAGTLSGEGSPDFQSGNDVTGGVRWVPFAAESAGFASSTRFAVTSVSPWAEIHVKAKYRMQILGT